MVIPHGLYDPRLNVGYITLGTSHDTSQFACDCLLGWWQTYGKIGYPEARSILLLCDCGGSNNARHYIFKEKLQELVNKIGIEIRIAHYPPYTSKYNPIEHRLFPHISRACRGVIFKDIDIVRELMQQTTTQMGLRVFVSINDKSYEAGKKASDEYRKNMAIVFDAFLPKWNYTAVPVGIDISPFYTLMSFRDKIQETKEILKRTLKILRQDLGKS